MDTIQMLNLILVVILVVILLLGFIAVLLIYKMRKKNEPKDNTISVKNQETNTNANMITR